MAGYGLTIIGAVFIGRLGPEPLSISVLASSFYNVAGLSVALGLSSGMETLCGQVGAQASCRVPAWAGADWLEGWAPALSGACSVSAAARRLC